MPASKPEIVVLAVLPVIPPGLIVQLPEGKPFRATLPVDNTQVGCVITPATGADGTELTVATIAVLDAVVHPDEVAST